MGEGVVDVRDLVKNVALGIVVGIIYYVVYLIILPEVIGVATGSPLEIDPALLISMLYVFIALGVVSTTIRHPAVVPIRPLSRLLGALILVVVTNNGVITTSVHYNGVRITATLNIENILYAVIAISLLLGALDVAEYLTKIIKS